jgi:hypothetical protein
LILGRIEGQNQEEQREIIDNNVLLDVYLEADKE